MSDPAAPPDLPTPDTTGAGSMSDFHKALIQNEAVANFAALNKVRESLIIAMARDVEKGGDGKRFIDALKQVHDEITQSQQTLQSILK